MRYCVAQRAHLHFIFVSSFRRLSRGGGYVSVKNAAQISLGNRRLLALARRLREIPNRRFDFLAVVGDNWKGNPDLSCGTTACALGWAATMPYFKALNLRLHAKRALFADTVEFYPNTDQLFRRAEQIFALTAAEAGYLFDPSAHYKWDGRIEKYPADRWKTAQVATLIENFVARRRRGDSSEEIRAVTGARALRKVK